MTVRSVLLAVLLVLAATLAAACGQDEERTGLLAQSRATDIKDGLADVETAVADGSCTRVREELDGLRGMLEELPARTDAELRQRLDEGVSRLEELAPAECEEQAPETTPETTPTVPTVPPETTETEPPVETTETEPPAETTPPPVEEVPGTEEGEEGGVGDEETPGNGNGNGNGNGPPGGIPPGQAGGEEAPSGR